MRRVIIIAYYWPPSGGGGVQRWLKFTKYLPEFGWQPVVYVPYNPQYPLRDESLMEKIPVHVQTIKGHIWEARRLYRGLKRLRHGRNWSTATEMDTLFFRQAKDLSWFGRLSLFLRSNLFVPDSRSLWIRPSVKRLKKWLRSNSVDVIVSTGPPHSCHLIALGLHRTTGIPWVADFRDPWTDIDYFDKLLLTDLNRRRHDRLQHAVLTEASRVITVSPSWAQLFEGYGAQNVQVITNGFDPDDIEIVESRRTQPDRTIQIACIGTLEVDRNPVALWRALTSLSESEPTEAQKLRIHLAGKIDGEILPKAPGVRDLLQVHGYVSHHEALTLMADADVLLLILNQGNDNNSRGRIPGKVFEYLAMRKPMLVLGDPDSDSVRLLRDPGSNWIVPHGDVEGMLRCLRAILTDPAPQIDGAGIRRFERRSLTESLSQVLNSVANGNP